MSPLQKAVREMFGVVQGTCPCCNKEVNTNELKDDISRKEYNISGLCQGCQDEMFQ